MAIPEKFWQPWAEVDQSGDHGGLPGELGEFVAPRLGDNPQTKNVDLHTVFTVIMETAAALSMHPTANLEGPPQRAIVEEVLRGLNLSFERIMDRTRSCSTSFFLWEHATPPYMTYKLRPVRYPLRNVFANHVIFFFLGTLVEVAEVNANGNHTSIDPSTSYRLIAPLHHLKSNIVRDWFDKEVEGEITQAELETLMGGISRPGPVIVPAGQSQESPDEQAVSEALSGIDVMQWYPTAADWAVFGNKFSEMYKAERVWQPEGAGSTTEDVAPQTGTPAGGTQMGVG